jgi:hypothetical protein
MRRGISPASAEIMLASITESTLRQYQSALNAWCEYCTLNNIDVYSGSIPNIIAFLTYKFHSGSSYSTVNSIKSALALIIGPRLSEDDRVKRFLRGVFKLRPSMPKYEQIWDVSVVLNYLRNIGLNNSLSLKELSKKTVTLLAIATGHRIQTFSLIKTQHVSIHSTILEIKIPDAIKTTNPGRCQPILMLPFFQDDPVICPAQTIMDYMSRTKHDRGPIDRLFLTFKRPFKKASVSTISRWIKETLKDSGIDVSKFTAYSTRHASTTAAASRGVNIDEIRRTAGWTAQSQTFAKFYNRPIINQTCFARAVIQ